MSSKDFSYAQRIADVERIVRNIEVTEDVEDALRMHSEAIMHLDHCRATIEAAKGKLEIVEHQETTDKQDASVVIRS